jgi:hypothetical protein
MGRVPGLLQPISGADAVMSEKPRYVIINDIDAPEPSMVCQWVPHVGYCYLDRRQGKPDHDGMKGTEATPIEAFGFVWTDNSDGTVSFYLSDITPTATYSDGEPRRWQSWVGSFERKQLTLGAIRKSDKRNTA